MAVAVLKMRQGPLSGRCGCHDNHETVIVRDADEWNAEFFLYDLYVCIYCMIIRRIPKIKIRSLVFVALFFTRYCIFMGFIELGGSVHVAPSLLTPLFTSYSLSLL